MSARWRTTKPQSPTASDNFGRLDIVGTQCRDRRWTEPGCFRRGRLPACDGRESRRSGVWTDRGYTGIARIGRRTGPGGGQPCRFGPRARGPRVRGEQGGRRELRALSRHGAGRRKDLRQRAVPRLHRHGDLGTLPRNAGRRRLADSCRWQTWSRRHGWSSTPHKAARHGWSRVGMRPSRTDSAAFPARRPSTYQSG